MQRAYAKVAGEYPDTKRVSVSPSTSNFFTGLMMPRRAFAVTNPFTGNITYNPETMVGQSDTDMENTLAHELTHVRQTQNTPWYTHMANIGRQMLGMDSGKPPEGMAPPMNDEYYWRPMEMEAFQTERDRSLNQHQPFTPDPISGARDIQLRKQQPIDTAPRYAFGRRQ